MFKKVNYDKDLNSKQQEIFNFHKVSALLADYGFNCIKLSDDWHGADFLAYHKDGEDTKKVQLKGRPTVGKKYSNKDIWMAFPIILDCKNEDWYLIEHDIFLEKVSSFTNWKNTKSWNDEGGYASGRLNKNLLESIKDYKIGRVNKLREVK